MEIRDLPPNKDPKGGSVPSGNSVPQKKPKSDQIRNATLSDYVRAHSHPASSTNGKPQLLGGFLHSNLFVALVIWLLSQVLFIGGSYLLTYTRTNNLVEWKTTVDLELKRMDEWGTIHGHYADERQDIAIVQLQSEAKNHDAQMALLTPQIAEIRAKINFVADLLDERTKQNKK